MPGALLVTVQALASQSALGAIDEQSRTARPFSKSWAVPVPSPKKKSVCWKPRVSLKALPAALHTDAVAAVSFPPSFSAWVLVDDPPCAIELMVRVRQARATAEPDKLELGETRARLLPRTRGPSPGLVGVSR